MDNQPPILSFEDVTIESGQFYETGMWNVSFALEPGSLVMVHLDPNHARLPLADAGIGLAIPTQGKVSFLGEDWQAMSADRVASRRGRIGRVFDDGGWVSHMSLEENILLAQRHHTTRRDGEIHEEALGLARLFGLPALPRSRPETTHPLDLQKSACIRAFLGAPQLILLERPVRGMYVELIEPLVNAVQAARNRGAAILWITDETQVWGSAGLKATRRAKLFSSHLHWTEKEP